MIYVLTSLRFSYTEYIPRREVMSYTTALLKHPNSPLSWYNFPVILVNDPQQTY